jgi:hypothetical protein
LVMIVRWFAILTHRRGWRNNWNSIPMRVRH